MLDREVDKRNFRRRIHAAGVLEGTGDTRREGSHRPARLYRFRALHDAETYLDASLGDQPGTGGSEAVSTSTLRHAQPTLAGTAVKPQRVGLIAARSKVEAQELFGQRGTCT